MKTVAEYLSHAEHAESLAALADRPDHKAQIQQIATIWRDLAKQREQFLQTENAKR